jgi:FkbM family methyltransferase
MKYFFDVGAHWGQDSLHIAKDDPDTTVIAFEPTPELASRLRWIAKEGKFESRYKVYQQAISDFDGESDFHLVVGDTGSASLNEFNDNLHQTWPGRTDFVVRGSIKVNVYRLETWLPLFAPEVTEIEHLHIDAQGSDLAVLRGLGSKLSMVKSGVVEVPQAAALRLYKGQHTKEETLQFLEENGFEVTNVTSQVNEDNIFFQRKK